jgi:hypothetical protein
MTATPPGFYAGPDDPLVSATFSDWWTRSFRLLATTWRPILLVQSWWVVPLLALGIISGLLLNPETATVESTADVRDAFGALAVAAPAALISVLLISIAQLASLQVVVQRATGQPVSVRAAWGTAFRRIHAMIGWGVLAVLLIGAGITLCFLPGIYLGCTLLILPAIVLLERNKGIGRAFELFHHKFGDSIARVATIIGIALVPSVIENVVSRALNGGYDPQASPSVTVAILGAIISTVFAVAISIVTAPLLLTAYADMRARREPFSTAYLIPQQPAYTQPSYPPTA